MTVKPESPPPEAAKPRRGFASMDPQRLRAVSSKGGSAPNRSAVRGFALMDDAKRREVSLKGLEARRDRMAPQAGATPETAQAPADNTAPAGTPVDSATP